MKLKLEIETWNWNLKLKLGIETWNWNFELKLEFNENQVIKLDLKFWPTNVYSKFWFWKYSPIFCLKSAKIGAFLPFLTPQGYLWGWSQVQKLFSNIPIETINFGFGSTALSFVFKMSIFGAAFGLFWALLGYFLDLLGLFLGSRSGSKTVLELTNVDYQLLFRKYSHIFLF